MVNIPREMPDLTPQQRRDNWWRYHWLYVLAGVLAVLTAAGIAWERFSRAEYDCGAALVTRYAVTQEELSALKTALEAAAEDSNSDGRVQVSVNDIQIDYTATDLDDASIRQMTTNVDKLHADFYTGQSGVFILDDPENFQRNHCRSPLPGRLGTDRGHCGLGEHGPALERQPCFERTDLPEPGHGVPLSGPENRRGQRG